MQLVIQDSVFLELIKKMQHVILSIVYCHGYMLNYINFPDEIIKKSWIFERHSHHYNINKERFIYCIFRFQFYSPIIHNYL